MHRPKKLPKNVLHPYHLFQNRIMKTNEPNEYISHLEKFGGGPSLLNIFGGFNTETITLNELRKIYFAKARRVHSDKMPTPQKNIVTECTKILSVTFKMAKRYSKRTLLQKKWHLLHNRCLLKLNILMTDLLSTMALSSPPFITQLIPVQALKFI